MTDNITNNKVLIQLFLILVAVFSLSFNINKYPLVDYDEATYAKVTIDTMNSGDILSLKLSNDPWFEKPPLYFWMSMLSVKVFGEQDFAFRIPSILFATLSLWLIFLIAYKTTGKLTTAVIAFFILLTSGIFYIYCRETRLDSGVVFAILAALYFVLLGWEKEKYLFWIFPSLAVGLLIKNIIAILAIPIILIYAFFYQKWDWLKSKYLWLGLVLSSIIFLPWHLLQSWRFGPAFWNNYLGYHVFYRAISNVTGSTDPFYYIRILLELYFPWIWIILLFFILLLIFKKKKDSNFKIDRKLWAPLFSALFLITLFSVSKTRLLPYILPAFPFFALFIAETFDIVFSHFKISKKWRNITLIILLLLGGYSCKIFIDNRFTPLYFEEKNIGSIVGQTNLKHYPFYLLNFPFLESFRYYGKSEVKPLDITNKNGRFLKGPLYLAIPSFLIKFFIDNRDPAYPEFIKTKLLYQSNYFILIYSDHDLTLPVVYK